MQGDILKTVQCELFDYSFDNNLQLLIEYVYNVIRYSMFITIKK